MSGAPKTVLVTDGDSRAALAVTRSLGQAGYRVLVGEKRRWALAQASRYCARPVQYPDPATDPAAFVDALIALVREHAIDAIVPVADVATMVIAEHRHILEPICRLPIGDTLSVRRAADKADIVRTAQRLGVPVPQTVFLESRHGLQDCLPQLSFPVVVKAKSSRLRTATGWISSGVRYAKNADELARDVAGRHDAEFPLLLQERIDGPGMGIFLCYDRGAPVAVFSHKRLREKPPSGGVSVLSESVDVPPVARQYSEALLRELNWQGVAMVEFKVDARDGTPRLMEINGRFWGSLQLAIDAGVDFPVILLRSLEGAEPRPSPVYRTGVKSRWLLGDLDSLMSQVFGGARTRWPWSARMRAMLHFMRLWETNLYYENPRLSDLGPWFCEMYRWIGGPTPRANNG